MRKLVDEILSFHTPDPIEMIGVIEGLKPCYLGSVHLKHLGFIKEICRYFSLSLVEEKFRKDDAGLYSSQIRMIVISKDIKKARRLMKIRKEAHHSEIGCLLGYPTCCIKYYSSYISLKNKWSFFDILDRTKKLFFETNIIFYYASRMYNRVRDYIRIDKLLPSLNERIPINFSLLHLINHVPCAFDCPKSIQIARRNLKLLETYDAKIAGLVEATLKKPILFFDDFRWVVFNGSCVKKENAIVYDSISWPYSLIGIDFLKKISKGNKIAVDNDKKHISVFKKGIADEERAIYKIDFPKQREKAVILDFDKGYFKF